jgi:hypothetical protein
MLIDEGANKMVLRALKDMQKSEDVYLVDHAFTFKQRTAYKTIKENTKLQERLENILKYADKIDLPVDNPYEKERPSLEDYLKQCEESKEPVKAYDLDNYEIKSLKEIKFREEVEEISLWSNEIHDPNDITKILMALPNLKAVWLNDNPV